MAVQTSVSLKKGTKTKFRVGVISPITETQGSALLFTALEAVCSLGFNVAVLAEGDESARNLCFECSERFARNFTMLESIPDNKAKILNKSDVVIFSTCPSSKELKEVISAGVVPVLPEECGLENFDAQAESGCAFTFESGNIWSLVAALVRASENKKFSWDWRTIKQNLAEAL